MYVLIIIYRYIKSPTLYEDNVLPMQSLLSPHSFSHCYSAINHSSSTTFGCIALGIRRSIADLVPI